MQVPQPSHASSTGLSTGAAGALAYLGWWITGLVLFSLEREDMSARFHAAQSSVALGAVSLLILLTGAAALASLSYVPSAFEPLVWLTAALVAGGFLLCALSAWRAATGGGWRLPLAARVADRMVGVREAVD